MIIKDIKNIIGDIFYRIEIKESETNINEYIIIVYRDNTQIVVKSFVTTIPINISEEELIRTLTRLKVKIYREIENMKG